LTWLAKTETVKRGFGVGLSAMMRTTMALIGAALTVAVLVSPGANARPIAAQSQARSAQNGLNTEVSAQRRQRRLQIYPRQDENWQPDVVPRYNPGPNAVRVCNAQYVQEFRPSGTVIVPHMSCYWRRG
jgi:hypothetical protein